MAIGEKVRHIAAELKGHIPFTVLGACLGIGFMVVFERFIGAGSSVLFKVFHPAHVVLSAMVTASMFRVHASKRRFLLVLLVGYFGSVGIATLSDIVIPHIGVHVLGLDIPSHGEVHHSEAGIDEHGGEGGEGEHSGHGSGIHFGFIEEWYIVNPAALLGILIAYFFGRTKFPHAGHVLISTWASSAYLLMNLRSELSLASAAGIVVTLFLATWVPCCVSDIVFPLLFVKPDLRLSEPCGRHRLHSHPHKTEGEGSV